METNKNKYQKHIQNVIVLGGKLLLRLPYIKRYRTRIYRMMGVKIAKNARISGKIIGSPTLIEMHDHSEINAGCFIVAKAPIVIGENSTLAYQVSLFTSAYPNGPWNKLSEIYPKVREEIIIGRNVWVGARAVILPGVHIGDFSVVAAGAVVTDDVPSGVLVAGVPAKIKKILKQDE